MQRHDARPIVAPAHATTSHEDVGHAGAVRHLQAASSKPHKQQHVCNEQLLRERGEVRRFASWWQRPGMSPSTPGLFTSALPLAAHKHASCSAPRVRPGAILRHPTIPVPHAHTGPAWWRGGHGPCWFNPAVLQRLTPRRGSPRFAYTQHAGETSQCRTLAHTTHAHNIFTHDPWPQTPARSLSLDPALRTVTHEPPCPALVM